MDQDPALVINCGNFIACHYDVRRGSHGFLFFVFHSLIVKIINHQPTVRVIPMLLTEVWHLQECKERLHALIF
jgi:hypothetical protein